MEVYRLLIMGLTGLFGIVFIILTIYVLFGVGKVLWKIKLLKFSIFSNALQEVYEPTAKIVTIPNLCFKIMKGIVWVIILISVIWMLWNWNELSIEKKPQMAPKMAPKNSTGSLWSDR